MRGCIFMGLPLSCTRAARERARFVAFPVMVAIHLHAGRVFNLALDHAVDQILQVIQPVPVISDDVPGVRGGNVQAYDAVRLRYFNFRRKSQ